MSSRKNKYSLKDKYFMNIAMNLALNNNGLTGPNPSVGCVIVKKNKIISYGETDYFGRPHAEIIALSKLKKNIKDTTVYLSLEPCTHYGKTPPCTTALIKYKVKKVLYSSKDLDKRTFNKSKKILNNKKIIVLSGLFKNKSAKIYKIYNFTRKNKLPYVSAKLACSKNLKIWKRKGQISNNYSKKVTHIIRSNNQAILTTYKTVNSDNPKLDCRIEGLEKFSPYKIIIDKNLKINLKSYLLFNGKKTIIFHSSNKMEKINYLKSLGVKTIFTNNPKKNSLNMKYVLKKIYNLGFTSVLIESGPKFLLEMINNNFINNFYLFKSNKTIKDEYSISIKEVIKKLNKSFKYKNLINTYLENDTLINYH